MDKQSMILECLGEVRRQGGADFAAFACQDSDGQFIRWRYATGNRNERFRRIVLRYGKGIAGRVIMSGRPMVLEDFQPQPHDDPREYPIMYAEELRTAVALPVNTNERVQGVLLLGYRQQRPVDKTVMDAGRKAAHRIAGLLPE